MDNLMVVQGFEFSSLQIAEWTGKEHNEVLKGIRKEIEELGEIAEGIFTLGSYLDKQNQSRPCYRMSEDGVMQLALKYDAVSRYKCIQEIKRLKNQQTKELPSYQIDDDDARFLQWKKEKQERLQLQQKTEQLQLEKESLVEDIVEAIRTKAHISDKKTATALNKTSQLSKEVTKLKDNEKKSGELEAIEIASLLGLYSKKGKPHQLVVSQFIKYNGFDKYMRVVKENINDHIVDRTFFKKSIVSKLRKTLLLDCLDNGYVIIAGKTYIVECR